MFKASLGQTRWWLGLVALALCTVFCGSCASANSNPVISNLEAEKELVAPSGSCKIECIASDPDGDSLTYTWSASKGDFSGVDEGKPVATWIAPDTPDICTITVKVTDARGGESISSLSLEVAPNNPPTVKNLIVSAKEARYLKEYSEGYRILKGKSCDIECVALDPESDELIYEWLSSGGNISGEGPAVTWTAPLRAGEFTIEVTASDSSGGTATKSIVFKVETCGCAF